MSSDANENANEKPKHTLKAPASSDKDNGKQGAKASAVKDAEPDPFEPRVRGESRYDQVSSMLMAVVMGAMLIAGWLFLVYQTTEAYASRVTAPLEIVEVSGSGGGSPEGEIGQSESVDVAGSDAANEASNNEADASEFEAPSVEATPAAMLEAASDAGESMAEVDLGAAMPTGSAVATGKRASRIGTGRIGFGNGPGGSGFSREERWTIIYNPGQTLDEYARQLDALGVELATPMSATTLSYGSHFSSSKPTQRIGVNADDRRLFFLWQGQGRKTSDVELLKKAGIDVGNKAIFQFYPDGIQNRLARLELTFKGRQAAEIRTTRFRVIPRGNSYDFEVVDQQTIQ
jgi:hypothetical protein